MKLRILFLLILFFLSLYSASLADEGYIIGKDGEGFYFQTEYDGRWYIGHTLNKSVMIGDTGNYSIRRMGKKSYLITDKYGKFLIEDDSMDKIESQNKENDKVKILNKNNQVLIPVALGYNELEINTMLLLDTGASITVLYKEIADKLGMELGKKVKLMVAGGRIVDAYRSRLAYIKSGSLIRRNVIVSILTNNGPTLQHKGLLGMNFLRHLNYHIDYRKNTIQWGKKGDYE